MKYLNREFKTYEDLRNWNCEKHVNYYKKLCKLFSENPTMELNALMVKESDILIKQFNLSSEEIEAIEIM